MLITDKIFLLSNDIALCLVFNLISVQSLISRIFLERVLAGGILTRVNDTLRSRVELNYGWHWVRGHPWALVGHDKYPEYFTLYNTATTDKIQTR